MSEFNLNDNDVKKIVKNASKQSGVDIGKMKKAADEGKLDDFIGKNLSPDASKKLKQVLSDKSAAKKNS
ncbi:MAG: hypothetical protein LIO43_05340 [Clostridiales bacterium]|nr:hypothetical protein [Clostridiales bacterium]